MMVEGGTLVNDEAGVLLGGTRTDGAEESTPDTVVFSEAGVDAVDAAVATVGSMRSASESSGCIVCVCGVAWLVGLFLYTMLGTAGAHQCCLNLAFLLMSRHWYSCSPQFSALVD